MVSEIIHCPELGRDISGLLKAVPGVRVAVGERFADGEIGCIAGHKDIVARAKAAGLPSVFVMEDDCEFTEHFNYDQWCEQAEWARAEGYDVLVGGCVQTYHPRIVGPGLIAVSAFHSAHCIVYFDSSYDIVPHVSGPFDLNLGKHGAKIVMTFPFVAVQRAGFSGILGHDVNYVPLYEGYEFNLGRMLGLI
jgi:hypothetical protein